MRKLRTYKGCVFNPVERMWNCGGLRYGSAAEAIASPYHSLTDDDHPELMRLEKEPYEAEPKVTLEDVVARFWSLFEHQMGFRLRGSIEADATRDLCKLIRTAFPHIDQEGS